MSNHKRPEKIEGYVHPSELGTYSREGVYKTFTEGQKKQDATGNTSFLKQYVAGLSYGLYFFYLSLLRSISDSQYLS
jgi:hypothetical protein